MRQAAGRAAEFVKSWSLLPRLSPRTAFSKIQPHHTRGYRRTLDRGPFFSQSYTSRGPFNGFERTLSRAFSTGQGDPSVNSIWTRRTVLAIIGLNTAVFGAWQYASTYKDKQLKEWLQRNFTVSWTNINQGRYHTLLTSAFSHNQPMHFIFNMVTLHAFGSVLASSAINPSSLVVMSVSFGVLSSCALLYWLKSKGLDKGKRQIRRGFLQRPTQSITIYSGLGASGILCGLGAAATCLAPFQRMILAVIPMPLFMCTAVFFAVDTYFLNKESQVGHAAHLGGSVAGFAYYLAFLRNHGNGVWPMLRRLVVRR